MIIFKQKEFKQQPPHLPLDENQKFILPEGYTIEIDDKDPKYQEQLKRSINRDIIKKLRKDIKDNYLYEDGPAGGRTHYLSEFSILGKHLTLSKDINKADRLIYRVKPPEIKNGKKIMKVILVNCEGHFIPGIGSYGSRLFSKIMELFKRFRHDN